MFGVHFITKSQKLFTSDFIKVKFEEVLLISDDLDQNMKVKMN